MKKTLSILLLNILLICSVEAQNSYSLNFDGLSDYVEVTDESAIIANVNQMTLSGWVYPRNTNAGWPDFDGFFGFRNESDADFYLLQLNNYKVEGRLRSGGGVFTIETAENSISPDTWHHLALTYDGMDLILYINGIEAGTTGASGQISNMSVPLKIGSLGFQTWDFDLDGQVDEVSLWDLALTEQEIQDYMYADLTGEEGLLGYWNFNEGSGTTANDASGNENHGSIYGATWSTDVPFYNTVTWHVAATGSDSTGDGSENNPFATIQTGIDSASDGNIVLVATGTYIENINYNGKNIVVQGENRETTIIDGNQNGSVATFNNGEGSTAILSGFTLRNGYQNPKGGGIYITGATPQLEYLIITENEADPATNSGSGGGVCVEYSDLTTLNHVILTNNTGVSGGGIFVDHNSNVILTNCTITQNTADDQGSGITMYNSSATFNNTILWGNNTTNVEQMGINNSSLTITYSDIEGGWEGEGNIAADPLFCNPDSSEYTLTENSPCIGTGENGVNIGALGVGCVDNIAPEVPTGLLVWEADESIELSWNESPDNDFYYFILEKSTDSVFADYVSILTTNTTYTDTEYELNVIYYYRIAAVDFAGNVSGYSEIVSAVVLSIEADDLVPDEFTLHQNYPNPFNPVTTLRYDLPENSYVNVTVYDMLGREIRTLVNTTQDAGFKSVIWDATNEYGNPVSAGVYLYKIQAGEFVQTKKMVLLK